MLKRSMFKRHHAIPIGTILVCVGLSLACGESIQTTTPKDPTSLPAGVPVSPRGDRLLSIDINEATDGDYDQAFNLALEAGVDAVSLSLPWDMIESAPGEYLPEPNYLAIANLYYPASGMPLSLMIGPIDTNNLRIPTDLRELPFDDALVIDRFKAALDYAFSQIEETELTVLAIGNEIDATLLADAEACHAYETFFQQTAAHARSLRPGLRVGTKAMLEGLVHDPDGCLAKINQHSDVILTTYYPLAGDFTVLDPAIVHAKFDAITSVYPEKPIFFLELGYPSSKRIGSSEEKQAEFIRQSFQAWDNHSDQIELISFTWLHDISEAAVEQYRDYYGVASNNFAAYLSSLGLRTLLGENKPAFETLQRAASARGW